LQDYAGQVYTVLQCTIMGSPATAQPIVWKSLAELFSKQLKGFLHFFVVLALVLLLLHSLGSPV